MERNLLLLSLLLGAAGFATAFFWRPTPRAPLVDSQKPFWALAVALPIAVFLLTLPAKPPFGAGQGFGKGFLLGAALGLVAIYFARREENEADFASFVAPAFLAVIGASLASIWHAETTDIFTGAATGWAAVALVLSAGRTSKTALLARDAAFFAALCALAALGVLREEISPESGANGLWSAAGLALAAMLPLGALLGTLGARRGANGGLFARVGAALFDNENAAFLFGFGAAALLFLGAAALLALNVLQEPSFFILACLGVLAGLLILVLSRDGEKNGSAAPLALVVMLGAFMAAFGSLQGYGAALMLIGAFLPVAFVRGNGTVAPAATKTLIFGLTLVIYRLFASRFGEELHGASLSDNYALFGFLAGALWPLVPANFARGENTSPVQLAVSGILALVGPAALIIFYGAKIAAPFLTGVALSCAIAGGTNSALWVVLIALSVAQWTGHLVPFAELSRAERVRLLAILAGGGAVLLIVADILGRVAAKRRSG